MSGKKFNVLSLLKNTVVKFINDNAIKYSASLAYYTVLSIAPLLLLIISFVGLVWGKAAIQNNIYDQLNQLVGSQPALQIQSAIKAIQLSKHTILASVLGIITLLIGVTGIFAEVQDSINIIWGFRAKPKKGLLRFLISRLLSFSMVVSIGFLLMVSLIFNALIVALGEKIQIYFPQITVYFITIFNNVFTFIVTTILIGIVFKVLPDAKISWKNVRLGAVVTSLLFMAGKFLISYYLGQSNMESYLGAMGSTVIVMVWVYYNAIILYLGAEFTQVYNELKGNEIEPDVYAIKVETKERIKIK